MASEKKIYVEIKPASITKIYDKKLKSKLVTEIAKAAKKAINKNPKLVSSKPSGWKKETDKGFVMNVQLVSLTKTEVKKELHIKASVALTMAFAKSGKLIKKLPSGSATVKIAADHRNPDGEALFIAGHAVATQIKDSAIKIMLDAK